MITIIYFLLCAILGITIGTSGLNFLLITVILFLHSLIVLLGSFFYKQNLFNKELEIAELTKELNEIQDKGDERCNIEIDRIKKNFQKDFNHLEDIYLNEIKQLNHKLDYTKRNYKTTRKRYLFEKQLAVALLSKSALIIYNKNKGKYTEKN